MANYTLIDLLLVSAILVSFISYIYVYIYIYIKN